MELLLKPHTPITSLNSTSNCSEQRGAAGSGQGMFSLQPNLKWKGGHIRLSSDREVFILRCFLRACRALFCTK